MAKVPRPGQAIARGGPTTGASSALAAKMHRLWPPFQAYTFQSPVDCFEFTELHQALLDATTPAKALEAVEGMLAHSLDPNSTSLVLGFVVRTPDIMDTLAMVIRKFPSTQLPFAIVLHTFSKMKDPAPVVSLCRALSFKKLLRGAMGSNDVFIALASLLMTSRAAADAFAAANGDALLAEAMHSPSPSCGLRAVTFAACTATMLASVTKDTSSRGKCIDLSVDLLAACSPDDVFGASRQIPNATSCIVAILKVSAGALDSASSSVNPVATGTLRPLLAETIASRLCRVAVSVDEFATHAPPLLKLMYALPLSQEFVQAPEAVELCHAMAAPCSAALDIAGFRLLLLCLASRMVQAGYYAASIVEVAAKVLMETPCSSSPHFTEGTTDQLTMQADERNVALQLLMALISRRETAAKIDALLTADRIEPAFRADTTLNAPPSLRHRWICFVHVYTHAVSLTFSSLFIPLQKHVQRGAITTADFKRITRLDPSPEADAALLDRIVAVREHQATVTVSEAEAREDLVEDEAALRTGTIGDYERKLGKLRSDPRYVAWLKLREESIEDHTRISSARTTQLAAVRQRLTTSAIADEHAIKSQAETQVQQMQSTHDAELAGIVWDPDELAAKRAMLNARTHKVTRQAERSVQELRAVTAWRDDLLTAMTRVVTGYASLQLASSSLLVVEKEEERARGLGIISTEGWWANNNSSIVAREAAERKQLVTAWTALGQAARRSSVGGPQAAVKALEEAEELVSSLVKRGDASLLSRKMRTINLGLKARGAITELEEPKVRYECAVDAFYSALEISFLEELAYLRLFEARVRADGLRPLATPAGSSVQAALLASSLVDIGGLPMDSSGLMMDRLTKLSPSPPIRAARPFGSDRAESPPVKPTAPLAPPPRRSRTPSVGFTDVEEVVVAADPVVTSPDEHEHPATDVKDPTNDVKYSPAADGHSRSPPMARSHSEHMPPPARTPTASPNGLQRSPAESQLRPRAGRNSFGADVDVTSEEATSEDRTPDTLGGRVAAAVPPAAENNVLSAQTTTTAVSAAWLAVFKRLEAAVDASRSKFLDTELQWRAYIFYQYEHDRRRLIIIDQHFSAWTLALRGAEAKKRMQLRLVEYQWRLYIMQQSVQSMAALHQQGGGAVRGGAVSSGVSARRVSLESSSAPGAVSAAGRALLRTPSTSPPAAAAAAVITSSPAAYSKSASSVSSPAATSGGAFVEPPAGGAIAAASGGQHHRNGSSHGMLSGTPSLMTAVHVMRAANAALASIASPDGDDGAAMSDTARSVYKAWKSKRKRMVAAYNDQINVILSDHAKAAKYFALCDNEAQQRQRLEHAQHQFAVYMLKSHSEQLYASLDAWALLEQERSHRGQICLEERILIAQIANDRPRGKRYRPPPRDDFGNEEKPKIESSLINRVRLWQRDMVHDSGVSPYPGNNEALWSPVRDGFDLPLLRVHFERMRAEEARATQGGAAGNTGGNPGAAASRLQLRPPMSSPDMDTPLLPLRMTTFGGPLGSPELMTPTGGTPTPQSPGRIATAPSTSHGQPNDDKNHDLGLPAPDLMASGSSAVTPHNANASTTMMAAHQMMTSQCSDNSQRTYAVSAVGVNPYVSVADVAAIDPTSSSVADALLAYQNAVEAHRTLHDVNHQRYRRHTADAHRFLLALDS